MRLKRFWVIIGGITFLILIMLFLMERQSRVSANKMFGNMSYLTDSPYFSEEALLVNGLYEWKYVSEDDVFSHYRLEYTGQYIYGDFNHDGLKDAVVIVIENSGGNAVWYTLAFLINDGKKLVHRTSGTLDDRAIINSIRQKNGKVIVDMFAHQNGDCMGGPTDHVKDIFEYSEGKRWIEGERISARSFFDPVFYIIKDHFSWTYVFQRWEAWGGKP